MELRAVEKAAEITNTLIGMIDEMLQPPRDVKQVRELDLAQLVEREALSLGAEGMGFETLAAGPSRSWAIHPFPAFSDAALRDAGAFDPRLRREGGRLYERCHPHRGAREALRRTGDA